MQGHQKSNIELTALKFEFCIYHNKFTESLFNGDKLAEPLNRFSDCKYIMIAANINNLILLRHGSKVTSYMFYDVAYDAILRSDN